MRAVASAKNIAGADRLARDIAHTETEIAYYLDRLNIADQHSAGARDQTVNRAAFASAIASLERRKQRLEKRQAELAEHNTNVVVFGEQVARPMGYGLAPKFPAYNLQSVVDLESGLILHNDDANQANDCPLTHTTAITAKKQTEQNKPT